MAILGYGILCLVFLLFLLPKHKELIFAVVFLVSYISFSWNGKNSLPLIGLLLYFFSEYVLQSRRKESVRKVSIRKEKLQKKAQPIFTALTISSSAILIFSKSGRSLETAFKTKAILMDKEILLVIFFLLIFCLFSFILEKKWKL